MSRLFASEDVITAVSPFCLDENAVARYLADDTRDDERQAVREHLDTCDRCRDLLAGLVRTLVTPEPDDGLPRMLPRGTNLSRYVVLDPIGRGGMGVVYAAYDPELDRKVALKLLRSDLGSTASGLGRSQLLSEAQAMARLSHPNIITVFDVGTWNDEVFFAMEFVRGQTLRTEQGRQIRPRRALDLYLAAGTGLAAAHQAGIVHRDFKPDNVLVGDDGRVRVTDFGLARTTEKVDARVAGTPAYMAPEQWRGASADERTDQYSFCVALYEALYGSRPIRPAGERAPSGPAGFPPPRTARVPPGVVRVLARGLQPDPAQRWPSMDALVAALREARRPFRSWMLVAAAVLLLATTGVWAQHGLAMLRVTRELTTAAQRLPGLLRAQADLIDLQAQVGLGAEGVLAAFGLASNMDAALGLAENVSEHQIAEAHEVMRSADLPGLKSRDALLLVNSWGSVVFNLADTGAYGFAAPAVPLLVGTMEGISADELWSQATLERIGVPLVAAARADDLLLVSARPVVRGTAVVGAMLTGSWLDRELLTELGRAVGARVALHAPDGGWAGARWPVVPPLGRVVHLRAQGRDLAVYGVALGTPGSRTPPGEAFVFRELAADAESGLASPLLRWALTLASLAAVAWLAWRRWWFR